MAVLLSWRRSTKLRTPSLSLQCDSGMIINMNRDLRRAAHRDPARRTAEPGVPGGRAGRGRARVATFELWPVINDKPSGLGSSARSSPGQTVTPFQIPPCSRSFLRVPRVTAIFWGAIFFGRDLGRLRKDATHVCLRCFKLRFPNDPDAIVNCERKKDVPLCYFIKFIGRFSFTALLQSRTSWKSWNSCT